MMHPQKIEKRPSFFTAVCSDDFTRLLRLPKVFMRKYESIFPKKAKLRIESGKTWDVKMEKMEDGFFCFTRGWKYFAQDLELKFGEFLVFTLNDGGCYIDVYVLGTNGCINDVHDVDVDGVHDHDDVHDVDVDGVHDHDDVHDVVGVHDDDDVHDVVGVHDDDDVHDVVGVHDDDDDDDYEGRRRWREMMNPCYYEIVLKPHNSHRVTVKRKLMKAAGLKGKKRVELVGKKCNVSVALDNTHKDRDRVDLAIGWAEFLRVNGLVYGKTYSFEFKQKRNVIQVEEVKMGV